MKSVDPFFSWAEIKKAIIPGIIGVACFFGLAWGFAAIVAVISILIN